MTSNKKTESWNSIALDGIGSASMPVSPQMMKKVQQAAAAGKIGIMAAGSAQQSTHTPTQASADKSKGTNK